MTRFPYLCRLRDIPRPSDPEKARAGFDRLFDDLQGDAAGAELAAELGQGGAGRELIECVAGSSPFLDQILRQDAELLSEIFREGPAAALRTIEASLTGMPPQAQTPLVSRALRIARRRAALVVALADIGNLWDLDQVVGALSGFARTAVRAAVRCVLGGAVARGDLVVADADDPETGSGYSIFAMGKLGAGELNYSSDIDLIVLYDTEIADFRGTRAVQDFFVRLTRDLVRLLHERTRDGYVFRTDLRLRPDAGATQLALTMTAAETYYESQGQNWERAAMIKAAPIAGDIEAGAAFLRRIRPFVWRKHLDFTAIRDIHSIKRQIHDAKGHGKIRALGHDIKLGRGGIREIEFFAQTQQLIAGGREPALRVAATQDAMRALASAGKFDPSIAEDLNGAYRFLRRVEHRLQMVNDEQTQTLPSDEAAFERFATFLGYASGGAFQEELRGVLELVSGHYGDLFEEAPHLGAEGSLSFTGTEDDPETLATLRGMGFREPHVVTARVRTWHHGRYRATRSIRARELLTELGPSILQSLAKTASPDDAFLWFDEFLSKLPAGVQLFSLFHAHPGLLDLVAEVLGSAPRLAEVLSRNPHLLDSVLAQDFYQPLPAEDELAESLDGAMRFARDFQDVLDIARRWTADRKFQAGVHILRGIAGASGVGPALTAIAETIVRCMLPHVEREFARVHGRIRDGGMAIVGFGKLGGREMAPASDLDLVFIYDCPSDASHSDGPKPLPVSQFFARLSQRLISALTALTGEGRLYEVDMRLRPSGNAGPIAVALETFRSYQRHAAWTWEHMALTRARPLAGPPALCTAIDDALGEILALARDDEKLRAGIADMRARIASEHGTENPWTVKYVAGGLIDLEFIAQYLQLRHAHDRPGVLDTNTTGAYARLARAGVIPEGIANELTEATLLARNVQGILRLCSETQIDEGRLPAGLAKVLAQAGGAADVAELKANLRDRQARVLGLFRELIGEAP